MKYLTLIILLFLTSCSSYVKKPEALEVYKQIGQVLSTQGDYLTLIINKVYKKEIETCKAKEMGLNLKTLECTKVPEK